jgi:hypothetical protein
VQYYYQKDPGAASGFFAGNLPFVCGKGDISLFANRHATAIGDRSRQNSASY